MYRRKRKVRRVLRWEATDEVRDQIAAQATYLGSPEHKTAPSPTGPPHPRSDASKCPNDLHERRADGTLVWREQIVDALRGALRTGLMGGEVEDGFPRYVWAILDGALYEARHLQTPRGSYKAYPAERDEIHDPEGLLP